MYNLWTGDFWNYPFDIFGLWLTTGNQNIRKWNCGFGVGVLYLAQLVIIILIINISVFLWGYVYTHRPVYQSNFLRFIFSQPI